MSEEMESDQEEAASNKVKDSVKAEILSTFEKRQEKVDIPNVS